MASANFDAINVELSRRIGDPVATAGTAGKVLTSAERDAYVNKAMQKLVADVLLGLNGNNEAFIEIFPELVVPRTFTTTAGGTYVIAGSSNADFFKLIDGFLSTVYIKVLPKHLYNIVKLGINDLYVPSASNLFAFELAGTLYFLPASSFNAQSVTMNFIKRPVHTDGSFYSAGDSGGDIPFYPHWNSKIAEIAEELVRIDRQFAS